MSNEERRRHIRYPLSIEVTYQYGVESFSEYTLNLSPGGLFIRTDRPLKRGSTITLDFTIPSIDHHFSMNGRVAWIRNQGDENGLQGRGVEFLDVTEKNTRQLIQFVVSSQLTQRGY